MAAGVDRRVPSLQGAATFKGELSPADAVNLGPHLILRRVAFDLLVPDQPTLLTPAVALHLDLQPGVLNVNRRQQQQHAGGAMAGGIRLLRGALHQAIGIDAGNGFVLPGLGGVFVDPTFEQQRVALGPQELITDLLPWRPPGRGVPAGQMKASGLAIAAGVRAPFSAAQHGGLVVLRDSLTASRTLAPHLTIGAIPCHVLAPAQHLMGAAAGHEAGVSALV